MSRTFDASFSQHFQRISYEKTALKTKKFWAKPQDLTKFGKLEFLPYIAEKYSSSSLQEFCNTHAIQNWPNEIATMFYIVRV